MKNQKSKIQIPNKFQAPKFQARFLELSAGWEMERTAEEVGRRCPQRAGPRIGGKRGSEGTPHPVALRTAHPARHGRSQGSRLNTLLRQVQSKRASCWNLKLGFWNLFGIWNFEFGI